MCMETRINWHHTANFFCEEFDSSALTGFKREWQDLIVWRVVDILDRWVGVKQGYQGTWNTWGDGGGRQDSLGESTKLLMPVALAETVM